MDRVGSCAHLDVLPVLHGHRVQLIRNHHLHRRQEVCALLLLNAHPQSQRTRNDNITPVEPSKQLDRLPRHLDPDPEVVVHVALEHVDVVLGPLGRLLDQSVRYPRRERELGEEAGLVLCLGLGVRGEEREESVDP